MLTTAQLGCLADSLKTPTLWILNSVWHSCVQEPMLKGEVFIVYHYVLCDPAGGAMNCVRLGVLSSASQDSKPCRGK